MYIAIEHVTKLVTLVKTKLHCLFIVVEDRPKRRTKRDPDGGPRNRKIAGAYTIG